MIVFHRIAFISFDDLIHALYMYRYMLWDRKGLNKVGLQFVKVKFDFLLSKIHSVLEAIIIFLL